MKCGRGSVGDPCICTDAPVLRYDQIQYCLKATCFARSVKRFATAEKTDGLAVSENPAIGAAPRHDAQGREKLVKQTEFNVKAVGHVRVAGDGARLEIRKECAGALEGIAGFSHLWVLFWCDRVDSQALRAQMTCQKPYAKGPDRLGLWATRSPVRPNPIAITPVSVLHVDIANGLVRVPFIDAEDGTPILDLKPYHPAVDRIRQAVTPEWCRHWPQWYEDSATFDWPSEINCP